MSKSLYTTYVESTAPTSSTIGVVGQWYLDNTTKKLYMCKAITTEGGTTSYEWGEIASTAYVDDTIASEITTTLNTPV